MKKNECKLRDMWGIIKCTNIRVPGKGESIFNVKTILNSMININLYIQAAQF